MMAQDADTKLLAQLGIVAANPTDYERALLAQAHDVADREAGEQGDGENVDSAQLFLRENDPQVRSAELRVQEVLGTLESEIAAVEAARAGLTGAAKEVEKVEDPEVAKESAFRGKHLGATEDGREAMHLELLDERFESLQRKRSSLLSKLKKLQKQVVPQEAIGDTLPTGRANVQASTSEIKNEKGKTTSATKVVSFVEDGDFDAALDAASGRIVETERERLIRQGVITPFSKVDGFERRVRSRSTDRIPLGSTRGEDELVQKSIANAVASISASRQARPSTRLVSSSELPKMEPTAREFRHLRTPFKRVTADEEKGKPVKDRLKSGAKRKRPQADKKWKARLDKSSDDESDFSKTVGFGAELDAHLRATGQGKRKRLRLVHKSERDTDECVTGDGQGKGNSEDGEESREEYEEEDNVPDAVFEGGLRIPESIYDKLFDYQQTGVKWMWELHCQRAGGIIGDEMGLGKTIQVIAFLAALHYSGLYNPSIVVCPVTLLRQWKRELKKWYPPFEAVILHDSAVVSFRKKPKKRRAGSSDEASISDADVDGQEGEREVKSLDKGAHRWTTVIDKAVNSQSGLVITTYEQLRLHREKLLDIRWGYAVLDEGHRVRNPDADVTLVCKQLQTVHRIIMTGAPIQNKLTELWSLFDFVFPGKMGVLPVFQAQFALPIQIGGYANATPLQVSTAYKCAVVLRDLVLPYLLRRMKADVKANLTKKTEHVLFCSLSNEQRAAYRAFLGSAEVERIMEGNMNSLSGIDTLRKICNHPDLLEREHGAGHPDYGNRDRSGKLRLVEQVLDLWKSQGHRVLLFTQTQQMLDIVQIFAESKGYEYRRMDGSTAIRHRMALIDEYNECEHVFLFILTTKVGGIGTNLIGANRVIIFDPDWNPSTDMQARERAWRVGQKKDVTIYRLITRGTIEEKVYHRQIYKHFLTNKILKDPKQRRIFKARDMRDLFTLQDDTSGDSKTETALLFGDDVKNILQIDGSRHNDDDGTGKTSTREGGRPESDQVRLIGSPSQSGYAHLKGKEQTYPGEEMDDDSRILMDLFEANGIHTAMDHDAILAVSEVEKAIVDQEAARVAQRATDALQQSRMLRASDDVAVPTWTGRSGEAGAPAGLRRRFGSTANSRVLTASAAQTTRASTTVQSQTRNNHNGDSSRPIRHFIAPGPGAGMAGGKTLSSDGVLSKMRELHQGALGAGLEVSSDGAPHASIGTSTSSQSSVMISSATLRGRDVQVSCTSTRFPIGRFGREASVPRSAEEDTSRSAPPAAVSQSCRGTRGLNGDQSVLETTFAAPKTSGPEALLAAIRSFLRQKGGSVSSATIVAQFKSRISSEDIPLFRELLKSAATLQKVAGEGSRWILRTGQAE